ADWVTATWDSKFVRRSGAVLSLDRSNTEQARFEFQEALLAEIAFPALDAASKEAGLLTLTLRPQKTNEVPRVKGGKKQATGDGKGKGWVVANFRLDISGLDCTQVNRIEPFAVRVPAPAKGKRIEFPNLTVTLAEATARSWTAWHENVAI